MTIQGGSKFTGMNKALLLSLSLAAGLCSCTHPSTYQSPYHLSFVSPGMKFLSLPAAVQNTIRAQAGMAEIQNIGRYEIDDFTYYKVWFARSRIFPPMYIAPNGNLLNADLTVSMSVPAENYVELVGHGFGTVSLGDLPPAVVKTINARAAAFEIQRIEQVGTDEDRYYEIHFKGPNAPAPISVSVTGELLRHRPIIDNRARRY